MVLEQLFDYFLQLNLVTTSIVILILVLRFTLKRHLSVHLQYVLWGILLFKLCFPIEMNSILSMFNYVPSFQQNSQEPKNIVYNMPATTETISPVADSVNTPHHVDFIMPLLTLIWIAGVILLFFLFLVTYLHTYKKLNSQIESKDLTYIQEKCLEKLKINRNIEVIVSTAFRTPFVFGIFKPKVVIPASLVESFDQQKLQSILMHELIHVKRYDYLFRQIMMINVVLHWYNPFLWIAAYYMSEDCEKSCDVLVVKQLNNAYDYASTLIDMAAHTSRERIYGVRFSSKKHVKERVKNVINGKMRKTIPLFVGALLILGVAIFTLTSKASLVDKENWKESSYFTETFPLNDGTEIEYLFVGEDKKIGLQVGSGPKGKAEKMPIVEKKPNKYMWYLWGQDTDYVGQFSVIAFNEEGERYVVIKEGPGLSIPKKEELDYIPSVPSMLEFPSSGLWKLEAYVGDKLFGTIIVKVEKG